MSLHSPLSLGSLLNGALDAVAGAGVRALLARTGLPLEPDVGAPEDAGGTLLS